MTHYGRSIGYAATAELDKAEAERELYHAAAQRVPETRLDFPNRIVDILKVAGPMLDGEIEYRRGNYDIAFTHIRDAIVAEDNLLYTEPWGWMLPARHSYGALCLEQGRVDEAARAYAEDLGLHEELVRAHAHPKNVWALHGYHECLVGLGQLNEALIIRQQLTLAQAESDVPIGSSCFCRLQGKSACGKKLACNGI